jgi:hypothetical protein
MTGANTRPHPWLSSDPDPEKLRTLAAMTCV